MDFSEVVKALFSFALFILGVGLSFLTPLVLQFFKAKVGDRVLGLLWQMTLLVVRSVEQAQVNDPSLTDEQMKEMAIEQIQAFLDAHGIKVPVAVIESTIEAAILSGLHKKDTLVLTPGSY